MQEIVRTAYGASLQTSELLNLPLVVKQYTTLNEKFNIHDDIQLADTDNAKLGYYVIGNGGHRFNVGVNNIAKPEPIQHLPRHAALYNHIPFIMRPVSSDLTPTERLKYRLRRIETHNAIQYVVYYGKVLNLSSTVSRLELRVVNNGSVTVTNFTPTVDDLNPTPPPINTGSVLTTTGDYIAASAKVNIILTAAEISEIMDVSNILYGDPNYAIVSELGLCSGVDKVVQGNFNGTNSNYTDTIGMQICSFISVFYPLAFINDTVNIGLDIGSVEPMLTFGVG
jgi:hypothetical protein